ncbi:MAG: MCE family protein, partial [Labilithrix sp.]|nr:MCE family protein [Labilithrix sp.]
MAKFSQAAKIGLFVVVTTGAGLLVYRTIHKETGRGGGYVVHAYIKDASGIAKHSRVTIAGIPVGSVENISLENGMARIDVRVNGDVTLHQTARLGVKSASLLGENVVVLSEGVGEPNKANGDEIETMPDNASVEDIKAQVSRIAELIEKVAQQLADSVGSDQGGRNISAILQNLA